jgi:hypothetical protein
MHFAQKKTYISVELSTCLLIQIEYAAYALPRARFPRPRPRPWPTLPVSPPSIIVAPRPRPRPRGLPRPCPRPRLSSYNEGSRCTERSYVRGSGEERIS